METMYVNNGHNGLPSTTSDEYLKYKAHAKNHVTQCHVAVIVGLLGSSGLTWALRLTTRPHKTGKKPLGNCNSSNLPNCSINYHMAKTCGPRRHRRVRC